MRTRLMLALLAASCSGGTTPPAHPTPGGAGSAVTTAPADANAIAWAPPAMTLAQSGIVPGWIDGSVDPCTDFYAYACGGFTKTAQIPADRSSWGTIQLVTKDSEDFLRQVLEHAAATPGDDPVAGKLGAYYAACMDEGAIAKADTAPLQPMLGWIAKVKDAKTAAAAVVAMHADGLSPLFDEGPQQDFADATQVILGLDQAGLGLPDRKYYLEKTGTIPATRKAYRAHQERMFALLGGPAAKRARAAAANAYRLETALAKAQQDDVVRRDPHAVYHRVDRDGLEKKVAPSFPWEDFLAKLGLAKVTAISVNEPRYFTTVARLLRTEKPQALRDYLTWTLLRQRARDLGPAWVDEDFKMRQQLSGVKALPPRWRRCVHQVDDDLGELLGQSYVQAKFGGDSKARAVDLTKEVLGAMDVELDHLPWMDAATRTAAKQKLAKMAYLVGYPDAWRHYDFAISRTDFAANLDAARRWELARQLGKIGKPVDRHDWAMTPPTVNAYYDPSLNELVLPAGQLQAPFFGRTFHPAVNFASTGGGTIGHEMTHGFDDEGSQFDGAGNLRDWWSKATKEQFAAAGTCVAEQYAQYEAVPGVKLDGKLTLGENIADNGGVKLGYEAYHAWRDRQATPVTRKVGDYTDDQLYFLAYAQSWCTKSTPESLEMRAHTNPHSPPRWRVNGVIVNQPGFGPAFACKAGAAMTPAKRCSVW